MKKYAYLTLTIFLLATGCRTKEEDMPKVTYPSPKEEVTTTEVKIDSTQIKVADLPVLMQGTKYLIFAVGDVRLYDVKNSKYGSSKTNSLSYSISNYNRCEMTGYLSNLRFQHVDSTQIHNLSQKPIEIQTVTYLEDIAKKINKNILVYTLADSDTNRDGKINSNDIKTLYISEINGKNFTKLSPDYEELVDWNTIDSLNRLYFRTIEDINKNGSFDKDDAVHYYHINLNDPNWQAVKYNPFE